MMIRVSGERTLAQPAVLSARRFVERNSGSDPLKKIAVAL
jgi:hypothetical protein